MGTWLPQSLIQTCTPNSHLYRVTYTRCRIDTINSPDDGHMAARNMQRIEINIHERRTVLQVGYLQRLYRDARSTEHKRIQKFHLNFPVPNFMKNCSVVLQLYNAYRQTDGRAILIRRGCERAFKKVNYKQSVMQSRIELGTSLTKSLPLHEATW